MNTPYSQTHAGKPEQTHMVVETEKGLKIVRATVGNYLRSDYGVQSLGTEAECKAELKRLKELTY